MSDRRVVRRGEGQWLRTRGMGERSPDRSPVANRHDALSGMVGMDPGDCANDPFLQLSERFSPGYGAPVLRAFDLEKRRITFSDLLAEDAPPPTPLDGSHEGPVPRWRTVRYGQEAAQRFGPCAGASLRRPH